MFSSEADLFFREPSTIDPKATAQSTLHLLRRDIIQCLGRNPTTGQPMMDFPALWPATIGILIGIDLLAKHFAGSDKKGTAGKHFRSFFDKYFPTQTSDDAEVIWQLRNALIHSFGMRSYHAKSGKDYKFRMDVRSGALIERTHDYLISLPTLHSCFESAIRNYREELNADSKLQANFTKMFALYGSVPWG